MDDDWFGLFERLNDPPRETVSEVFTLETLIRGIQAISDAQPSQTVMVLSATEERYYRRLLALERRRVALRDALRAAGRLRDGR